MGLIALGTAEERDSDCKDRPAEDIQTERRNGQRKRFAGLGGGSTGRNGALWPRPHVHGTGVWERKALMGQM